MRHRLSALELGKRLGVPEFQQTAAVWERGILQHEFGEQSASRYWTLFEALRTERGPTGLPSERSEVRDAVARILGPMHGR